MSANLSFAGLFTYDSENSSKRLPLHALGDDRGHVHGLLKLEIAGRVLPHMGYFGPDDVCFNTWIEELSRVVNALAGSEVGQYTFDEGEQGQPAFSFKREGSLLYVSVVDSLLSGATGDADFQDVSCRWAAFHSAADDFFAAFRAQLRIHCPAAAEAWWARHAPV